MLVVSITSIFVYSFIVVFFSSLIFLALVYTIYKNRIIHGKAPIKKCIESDIGNATTKLATL